MRFFSSLPRRIQGREIHEATGSVGYVQFDSVVIQEIIPLPSFVLSHPRLPTPAMSCPPLDVPTVQHAITLILLIPNEKRVVGIVVGRHGLRLKKILDTSHCTITVEK